MGLLAITGSENVNGILSASASAAYDQGCYRGISPQEYRGLQDRVSRLSAADRRTFDESPTLWTGDRDQAFSDVLNALRQNQTYEQYLQTARSRPPADIDRPATCDLIS